MTKATRELSERVEEGKRIDALLAFTRHARNVIDHDLARGLLREAGAFEAEINEALS